MHLNLNRPAFLFPEGADFHLVLACYPAFPPCPILPARLSLAHLWHRPAFPALVDFLLLPMHLEQFHHSHRPAFPLHLRMPEYPEIPLLWTAADRPPLRLLNQAKLIRMPP